MTFSLWSPPSLTPAQSGAMPDIIGNILRGYTGVTNARYLKPNLEEQLQKAKLYNQFYGPNMESQIGLRGAQAGHLGAMTQGQNYQNEYLPEHLKTRNETEQMLLMQNRMLNDALKRRLSGQSSMGTELPNGDQIQTNPNQGQMPTNYSQQTYEPGSGAPPTRTIEQTSPFSNQQLQNPEFNQSNETTATTLPNGAPQLTEDDIVNKKFFGQDTFTPKYKAWIDAKTSGMKKKQAEEFKNEAKKDFYDFKETQEAQHDVPVLKNALVQALRMKQIIESRPAFYGHTPLPLIGKYYNPAQRFAQTSTDPLSGEIQTQIIPLLADMEKQLSSKGNQLALKISSTKFPTFEETQASALGKANGIIDQIISRLEASQERAGGEIKKIGKDRYKKVNGEWHLMEKGDY